LILTTFKSSIVLRGSWSSIENRHKPKTEPPSGNLACQNLWNALYVPCMALLLDTINHIKITLIVRNKPVSPLSSACNKYDWIYRNIAYTRNLKCLHLFTIQLALVIWRLFICKFAYSRSKNVYQTSRYTIFPSLFDGIGHKIRCKLGLML